MVKAKLNEVIPEEPAEENGETGVETDKVVESKEDEANVEEEKEVTENKDGGEVRKRVDVAEMKRKHVLKNPDLVTIGMVGFPNVGKSSVVNVLCGKKLVGVAARPGKTRNFQTIFLEKDLLLCDCPGLVFPSIVSSRAEMVCNGVYPIDNLREYMEPIKFVADSIPRKVLEFILKCSTSSDEYKVGASRLLHSYAVSRGYMMPASGLPDYHKASRIILKAVVNGELIFARLPEGEPETKHQFNIIPDKFSAPAPLINEKNNKGRRFKTVETQIESVNDDFFEGIAAEDVIDVFALEEDQILGLVRGERIEGAKLDKF